MCNNAGLLRVVVDFSEGRVILTGVMLVGEVKTQFWA